MDEHHVLPPLVCGKLRGFLNFFVDEINIFKNTYNLEECEVVVQVLWWGEPTPVLIRPEKFILCKKKMTYQYHQIYHSINYELKTDLNLLEKYLKACQVLELVVLELFKNIVIGSAFLKNLVKIIGQSNDQIVIPIVDYCGEIIGEMKIHTDFITSISETNNSNCLVEKQSLFEETDLLLKTNTFKKEKQELIQEKYCNKIQELSTSPNISEKLKNHNYLVNKPKAFKHECNKMEPKNKEIQEEPLSSITNGFANKLMTSKSVDDQFILKTLDHNFPQVDIHTDYSKVLFFPIKKEGFKKNLNCKPEPKLGLSIKTKENHIPNLGKPISQPSLGEKLNHYSCKKKVEAKKKVSNNKFKTFKKANAIIKNSHQNIEKFPEENSKNIKQVSTPRVSPISLPSSVISNKSVSLSRSTSAKITPPDDKKKILDYLLGFDMDKEEEYKALNNFKKMSPCQNFVETVSELFETREINNQSLSSSSSEKNNGNKKNKKVVKMFKNFKFNFNDPIEKKYYETFFANSTLSVDFEIAEILNEPRKTVILRQEKIQENAKETVIRDIFQKEEEIKKNLENCEELNLIRVISNENHSDCQSFENYYKNNSNAISEKNKCERCKYYKKLNELDTIIESLKNFEKNILNREKETNFLNFE